MKTINVLLPHIGKFRFIVACFFLLSTTTCVADISGLYPVVTSYNVQHNGSVAAIIINGTLVPVTISDDEANSGSNISGSSGVDSWAYVKYPAPINALEWSNGYASPPPLGIPGSAISLGDTIKYLQSNYPAYYKFTSTHSYSLSGGAAIPKCYIFGSFIGSSQTIVRPSQLGGSFNRYTAGDSGCIMLPPSNESCSLVTTAINFDFGTMNSDQSNGVSQSKNLSVTCSAAMNYKLQLISSPVNNITLSNNMRAEFTAEGKSLGSTLTGKAGSNTVGLKATLSGAPTKTGTFTGSSILVVSYP